MKANSFASAVVVTFLTCLSPCLGSAEDCIDYGSFPGSAPLVCGESGFGHARDVVLQDDYAFVVDDVGLKIIDRTVLEEPTIIASINTPGQAQGLAISGDWAYIADNEQGLQVVSIVDFNNLEIVASIDPTWTFAYDVYVSGDYVYVAGLIHNGFQGLFVVDVSTPSSPEIVNIVGTGGSAWSIAGSGDTLFLSQYWSSSGDYFIAIDISTPTSPIILDSIPLPAPANCVAIDDSLATVSWGERDFSPGGMSLVDITDPANLHVVGELPDLDYPVLGLAFREDEVLVCAGNDVLVVDIAMPDSMLIVDSIATTNGQKWTIELVESIAYICGYNSLDVVDVSEPGMSEVVATVFTGPCVRTVVSQGRYIFSGSSGINWPSTLRVYHLANPPLLNLLAEVELSVSAMCMYQSYLLVVSGSSLLVFDLSSPFDPNVIGQTEGIIGSAKDMVCTGSSVYIVTNTHFMSIDVSNPLMPAILGGVELTSYPAWPTGVEAIGGYALVVTSEYPDPRILTIDVSNPVSPEIIAENALVIRSYDIAISDQYAYLAGEHGSIAVIDVSNPLLPVQLGLEDFNNIYNAESIQVSGEVAYMANSDLGLVVVDIEEPTSPSRIGSADTPYHAVDVVIGEDYVCLADVYSGVQIASLQCGDATGAASIEPKATFLTDSYPNPFNPNTTIHFTIGEPQHVNIAVYDVNGKLVKTLTDEQLREGQHRVSWNGDNSRGERVSSGVYFISMSAKDFRQSRQVVLVK